MFGVNGDNGLSYMKLPCFFTTISTLRVDEFLMVRDFGQIITRRLIYLTASQFEPNERKLSLATSSVLHRATINK